MTLPVGGCIVLGLCFVFSHAWWGGDACTHIPLGFLESRIEVSCACDPRLIYSFTFSYSELCIPSHSPEHSEHVRCNISCIPLSLIKVLLASLSAYDCSPKNTFSVANPIN